MIGASHRGLQLITGSSHPVLARNIAKELDLRLCKVELGKFANGEIDVRIMESVRGDDVFVVQPHGGNVNDSIIEQAIIIDAAKRASAGSITAVCPFFGYGRQDRKAKGREPISARLVVDILTNAGADRILSVDLHSGQIQGFMEGPFEHLIARPIIVEYLLKNIVHPGTVVVAPDAGRVKSAERFANALTCELAIVHKHRSTTSRNSVEARHIIGEVSGKTCIIVDDMIDTAVTLAAAADLVSRQGASEVYGVATHGLFSGPAKERIEKSSFKKLIVTDTLPQDKRNNKIFVLPIAPMIADAIREVYMGGSISGLFPGGNQF